MGLNAFQMRSSGPLSRERYAATVPTSLSQIEKKFAMIEPAPNSRILTVSTERWYDEIKQHPASYDFKVVGGTAGYMGSHTTIRELLDHGITRFTVKHKNVPVMDYRDGEWTVLAPEYAGLKIEFHPAPEPGKLIGQRVAHHRVADLIGAIIQTRYKKGAYQDTEVLVKWDSDIYRDRAGKPPEWWDMGNVAFMGKGESGDSDHITLGEIRVPGYIRFARRTGYAIVHRGKTPPGTYWVSYFNTKEKAESQLSKYPESYRKDSEIVDLMKWFSTSTGSNPVSKQITYGYERPYRYKFEPETMTIRVQRENYYVADVDVRERALDFRGIESVTRDIPLKERERILQWFQATYPGYKITTIKSQQQSSNGRLKFRVGESNPKTKAKKTVHGILKKDLYTEPTYDEQTGELMKEGGEFIGNKGDTVEILELYPKERVLLILNKYSEDFAVPIEDVELKEKTGSGNPGPERAVWKSYEQFVDAMLKEDASQFNDFKTPQDRKYHLYDKFARLRSEYGIRVEKMPGSNQVLVYIDGVKVYDSDQDRLKPREYRELLLRIVRKLPVVGRPIPPTTGGYELSQSSNLMTEMSQKGEIEKLREMWMFIHLKRAMDMWKKGYPRLVEVEKEYSEMQQYYHLIPDEIRETIKRDLPSIWRIMSVVPRQWTSTGISDAVGEYGKVLARHPMIADFVELSSSKLTTLSQQRCTAERPYWCYKCNKCVGPEEDMEHEDWHERVYFEPGFRLAGGR